MESKWDRDLLDSWNKNQVVNLPGAFYFGNYLSEKENEKLLKYCLELKKSRRGFISGLLGPKVCIFQPEYSSELQLLINKLKESKIFVDDPIQLSINEYKIGDKMVPHKDGLGNFGVIVSCGSTSCLDFYYKPAVRDIHGTMVFIKSDEDEIKPLPGFEKSASDFLIDSKPDVSVFMEPRSILILSGDAFINYVHAIDARDHDVLDKSIGNLHLISENYQKEGIIARSKLRVSLVLWDSRDFIKMTKKEILQPINYVI